MKEFDVTNKLTTVMRISVSIVDYFSPLRKKETLSSKVCAWVLTHTYSQNLQVTRFEQLDAVTRLTVQLGVFVSDLVICSSIDEWGRLRYLALLNNLNSRSSGKENLG